MNSTNIKENMGNVDRILRTVAAVIFVVAFFHGVTSGTLGLISLGFAVIFLATAIFGLCPLYSIIGLNTKGKHSTQ